MNVGPTQPPASQSCSNCRYAVAEGGYGYLHCHRYPPQEEYGGGTGWPFVGTTQRPWCGEWRSRGDAGTAQA